MPKRKRLKKGDSVTVYWIVFRESQPHLKSSKGSFFRDQGEAFVSFHPFPYHNERIIDCMLSKEKAWKQFIADETKSAEGLENDAKQCRSWIETAKKKLLVENNKSKRLDRIT
jgi:hypothetical protein